MDTSNTAREALNHLDPVLLEEIIAGSQTKEIPANTEILREGQYVKVIPIVLRGLVKVFTAFEDRELLLYYIQPKESCIMSFAACLANETSKVYASTEEDSILLLIPIDKLMVWTKTFPDFNRIFFQQYNLRYSELLTTIHHLLFTRLDSRLYDYLLKKVQLTGNNPLKISHRQIATELGTAREVITRVIKKLENEGKVIQHTNSIEIPDR